MRQSCPCPGDAGRTASNGPGRILELSEIYGLRLGKCELVALSACSTNVGLRQPLEMGATLSRAFLSAGAWRVVASQWPVPDKSTAELMTQLFREIAEAERAGKSCDYSGALQKARDHVRYFPGNGWTRVLGPVRAFGPRRLTSRTSHQVRINSRVHWYETSFAGVVEVRHITGFLQTLKWRWKNRGFGV